MMGSAENRLSEREQMLAGGPYRANDPALIAARQQARALTALFNATGPAELDRRLEILTQLLAKVGQGVEIEPPFRCDYGDQIFLGDGVYMNFDCVILDCNRVEIGAQTLLGPGVHIYAATHAADPAERAAGLERSAAVRIGRNVWIGGGAIICPGATIGDDSTIGAGSVVASAIPACVVAAGNPCRVIRAL